MMRKCIICNNSNLLPLYDLSFKLSNTVERRIYHKCASCKCVFVDEISLRKNLNRLYDEDYYVYTDDAGLLMRAKKDYEKFIRRFLRNSKTLLEIGCAKGHLLARARDDGWIVTGVEISKFASNIARKRFNLDVYSGNIEDINFSGKRFDLIVMFDVIEHVADPIRFLSCLRRLLNSGGTMLIDTPNPESIFSKLTYGAWVGFNVYHLQLFGFKTWQVAARKSSLKITDIRTDHYDFFDPEERWRLAKWSNIHLHHVAPLYANFRGFNRLMNLMNSLFPKKLLKSLIEKRLGDQWILELQNV